jgi:hypothetical protein
MFGVAILFETFTSFKWAVVAALRLRAKFVNSARISSVGNRAADG